jgi:hypothetical protein
MRSPMQPHLTPVFTCMNNFECGFELVIVFIGLLQLLTTINSRAIVISHTLKFTAGRDKSSQSAVSFTTPLVTASNGGCSFSSWLPYLRYSNSRPTGTSDQFFPLLSLIILGSYGFVDVGRPLWREVGSVVFSFCWVSPEQPFSDLSPTALMSIVYCLYFWDFPICSWSSSCGRQTVDQFVWVSGLPLGPLTTFYLALLSSSDNYFILLSKASSLTRKRVCSLQCNHLVVRRARFLN